MKEFIKTMPKVDLHLHLDGSVKPSTLLELASQHGIQLPTTNKQSLVSFMQIEDECKSLTEYLKKFDLVLPVMQTIEAIERISYEVVEQASFENCKYIEVRFAPQLHRNKGLSIEEVMTAVLRGLEQGQKQFGVISRAIVICMRHQSVEENIEVIRASSKYLGTGVVGVDLAGNEASYPARMHQEVFKVANEYHLPITIHAGEAAGPESIYDAVTYLGADRIGHGIRLKEDGSLFEVIKQKQIPLEMCPISNIQTKASESWEHYPLKEYFEKGLLVTVNTDNLTVSNTTITKEYETIAENFSLSTKEICTLIMNGVEAAFLPLKEKQQLADEFSRSFSKILP
ncbi:adenosine deaminase [Bacillus alkalicellulosilyticus]|uniref:adenosine deaminase n=1 Tax=Alkalihalobacterium alkalicellulosilyticum TaxID=1912214 RepID=UPI001FE85390|nr:adenosine deaminase [Bacillus alkalicellulosilyticus]